MQFLTYLVCISATIQPQFYFKMDQQFGSLYIVSTPIGNLEDITLRAIRTLKEVDLIAAEDTRHSQKLLSHLGIKTRLISYYREREAQRSIELVKMIKDGKNIALISDAGTPAISDPGAILVQQALRENIQVVPIPGVSALTAAVSCAGNHSGTFLFLGFPPAKSGQRKKILENIKQNEHPVVFYESPRRVQSFLEDCLKTLGDREVLWARELTKTYEDIQKSTLQEMVTNIDQATLKGEFVLIIWPGKAEQITDEDIVAKIQWYDQNSDLRVKEISKEISGEHNISRSHVYQLALTTLNKK